MNEIRYWDKDGYVIKRVINENSLVQYFIEINVIIKFGKDKIMFSKFILKYLEIQKDFYLDLLK